MTTFFSCKKEEKLEEYDIKIEATNNIPLPIKADFEVFINIDSQANVHFINKSKNFIKVTWHFGDNTTSNEINPTHYYFSTGNNKTVKLVVENKQHQKDSISIPITFGFVGTSCNFFLTDLKNKVYTVHNNNKIYSNDGKFSYSLGYKSTTKPIQFIDSFFYNTYTTEQCFFYIYYTVNNITTYKKYITLDLKDFYALTIDLGAPVNFYHRSYTNGLLDPEIFSDTVLNLKYNNGLLELTDNKLGHSFRGYLSFTSWNTYKFSMPYKENKGLIETEEIFFYKNSKDMYAEHKWNGGFARYTTTIYYQGVRK